jgi:hypothetical protein
MHILNSAVDNSPLKTKFDFNKDTLRLVFCFSFYLT